MEISDQTVKMQALSKNLSKLQATFLAKSNNRYLLYFCKMIMLELAFQMFDHKTKLEISLFLSKY